MASPIVSVPEPVSSLNVEIGVNPALYALYQTSHLIAPTRPGESPSAFTADLAGTPESTTPIEGNHPGVTSVFAPGVGRVLQIENTPLIVGARVPLPVIGARVYRITGFAQRIINPADPAGDSILLGAEMLDGSFVSLGTLVIQHRPARVIEGMITFTGTLARAGIGSADVVIPPNVAYLRPFLAVYGADGRTIVAQIEATDVTNAEFLEGAVTTTLASFAGTIAAEVGARATGDALLNERISDLLDAPTWRDPGRPGDNPKAFTSLLSGSAEDLPPLGAGVNLSVSGRAQVQNGAGIVALRDVVGFGRRVWQIHAEVRRLIDPTDPAGDSVALRVAWLRPDKTVISTSTLGTTSPLPVSSHVAVLSGRISTLTVNDVTAPPAGAAYARPYIQTWGSDGETAIIALRHLDVTESHIAETADLSSLIADTEAAAQAALDAASNVVQPNKVYATVSDLIESEEESRAVGAVWQAGPHSYVEVAEGEMFSNAASVKLRLLTGENGHYNFEGLGGVGDGIDTMNFSTYGWNTKREQPFFTQYWKPNTVYLAVGTLRVSPILNRMYRLVTPHMSGVLFATDLSKWEEVTDWWNYRAGVLYTVGDAVHIPEIGRSIVCKVEHLADDWESDMELGYWEWGEFRGTDNYDAMMRACNVIISGGSVYFPGKKFRIGDHGNAPDTVAFNLTSDSGGRIYGETGSTWLLMDELSENMVTGRGGRFLFGDDAATESPRIQKRGAIYVQGLGFAGRWSHAPGSRSTHPNGGGFCPMRFHAHTGEEMSDLRFRNIRNKGMRNAHNTEIVHRGHVGMFMADGMVRTVEATHGSVSDCSAAFTADDTIDLNVEASPTAFSQAQILVTGIRVFMCKTAVIVNNGTQVTISGVSGFLCGACLIAVPRAGAGSAGSGLAPHIGINLSNSYGLNTIEVYDETTGAMNTTPEFSSVINAAGNKQSASGVVPHVWDPVNLRMVLPWDRPPGEGFAPSFFHLPTSGDDVSQGRGGSVNISDNGALRTLPPADRFTDWGFGPLFTKTGWKNPQIRDEHFKSGGFSLSFDVEMVNFADNMVDGHDTGLSFNGTNSARVQSAFRNGTISGFNTRNTPFAAIWLRGVSESAMECHWNLEIRDCLGDVDPFLRSVNRSTTVRGGWENIGFGATGVGIKAPRNLRGVRVVTSTYRNCLRPIDPGNGGNLANIYQRANTVVGDFTTSAVWNANNKGVGVPPACGRGWSYVLEYSDPTDAGNYEKEISRVLDEATAQPTTGWYPRNAFVENLTPTGTTPVRGWLRKADGLASDSNWHEVLA